MNTYLIQSKVKLIKDARAKLFELYNIDYTPFTRKIYFYFFIYEQKKYVHKESLEFVYSNAETYTEDIDPYYCNLTKCILPVDVCNFLESYSGTFLPKLLDSNNTFLVYEYVNGDPIESVNQTEFFTLKLHHEAMELTPFYNSMTYNLIRTEKDVILVDLKHFENKKDLPFFVYLYNKDNCVNRLYIESTSDLDSIKQHLALDYPIDLAEITIY